jgi:hypothetical protein
MPRVLVVGRETLVIALRSLHVPGMLVHHERPPTDLLSPLPTPALPARLTTSGIYLLLQLWHGKYWEVARSAVTYLPQFYCFRVLHGVVQTQGAEWWQFGMFDYLMPLPVPDGRFWRSVWPPVIFTLLFSVGVSGGLRNIEKLDLVVERVVHREPFTRLHAS